MLQRTQQCSRILARHVAARAALSSGNGAPALASILAPLACTFSNSPPLAPTATPHTLACTYAVPAHSFHTSSIGWQQASLEEEPSKEHPKVKPDAGEKGKTYDKGFISQHPGSDPGFAPSTSSSYMLMHPVYSKEYLESVHPRHKVPQTFQEKTGYWAVTAMRWTFDKITFYGPNMNEGKWLLRIVFLETVAGVPGMVAAALRHMRSLRRMERDRGWIHTLLEEAENERMHLLTFLQLSQPSYLTRAAVLLTQGIFTTAYTLFYAISPGHCHAFIGYLEEEAVKTYTHCLSDIDNGRLPEWEKKPAPDIAKWYWKMPEDATMRDLILNTRADEACHSHVNHTFSDLKLSDKNPFLKGNHMVA